MSTVQFLDQVTKKMAEDVRPLLNTVTREKYIRFLDFMYHYTKKSGERLSYVSTNCEHPEVAPFFGNLAQDEANHYQLAELDLISFQTTPSQNAPALVNNFHSFWMNLPTSEPEAHLGALYVLENVGGYLKESALQNLARLDLKFEQARFVSVHLEADIDHGDQCQNLCSAFSESRQGRFIHGAQEAARFWVELHRLAFQ